MASPRAASSSTTPTPRARNQRRRSPLCRNSARKQAAALAGGNAAGCSAWCPRQSPCPWAWASLRLPLSSAPGRTRPRTSRGQEGPHNSARANRPRPRRIPPKHNAPCASARPARPTIPRSGCTRSWPRRSRARRRWSMGPHPWAMGAQGSHNAGASRPGGGARGPRTSPTPWRPILGRPPAAASAAVRRGGRWSGGRGGRSAPTPPHGASWPSNLLRQSRLALCSLPTSVGGHGLLSRARRSGGSARFLCRPGSRMQAGARCPSSRATRAHARA